MIGVLILIPAYEPDLSLVQLVRDLRTRLGEATILVVDDGSGGAYDGVFAVTADAGAHLLRLPTNRGKGAALKAGFAWASEHAPGRSVVCADCDGQHAPADIARVATLVRPGAMVLGGRRFTGAVPRRSRVGNTAVRGLFRLVSGTRVHDTQTGLRAYPVDLLSWLCTVPGERFEYEFNLLLAARAAGVSIVEVPIETIYLDANASSHFRPVRDSLRICAPMLRFGASSLTGYVVDMTGLVALMALTGNLAASVVGARLLSATVNFTLNRSVVFHHAGNRWKAAGRYGLLAAAMLAANVVLMAVLVNGSGLPLLLAKVAVELALLAASYGMQHRLVFAPTPREHAAERRAAAHP